MSVYCCSVRTNYFRVKDENAFRKIMDKARSCDFAPVTVDERVGNDGMKYFEFEACAQIGIPVDECGNETEDDVSVAYFDSAVLSEKLMSVVADDDAVIIMEAGSETGINWRIRYIVGDSIVITHDGIKSVNMVQEAQRLAGKMLGNPEYRTVCEY